MKELRIEKNDSEQRLDRFLKKYLQDASTGFIYKMIRKKNIKVNDKKANPEMIVVEGDLVQLFLSDETIEKFKGKKQIRKSKLKPSILYEDENIMLINKAAGLLSHGTGQEFEENVVDSMIMYLIEKGDYVPRIEKTFTPSICNRLDRNTSGIIIGAKNYDALKAMNQAIKEGKVNKYYKTIVKGNIKADFQDTAYLTKDEDRNKVTIWDEEDEGTKEITTKFKVLKNKDGYTLLEVELITGRTHQIRSHLRALGYYVIGDRKYGDKSINDRFNNEYGLDNQYLHGYRLEFNGLEAPLEYLNGKEFIAPAGKMMENIEKNLF